MSDINEEPYYLSPEVVLKFSSSIIKYIGPISNMNDIIDNTSLFRSNITTSKEVYTKGEFVIDPYGLNQLIPPTLETIRNITDEAYSNKEIMEQEMFIVTYLTSESFSINLSDGIYYYDGNITNLPIDEYINNRGVFIEQTSYEINQDGFHGKLLQQKMYEQEGRGGLYARFGTIINNLTQVSPWVRIHDSMSFNVSDVNSDLLSRYINNLTLEYETE